MYSIYSTESVSVSQRLLATSPQKPLWRGNRFWDTSRRILYIKDIDSMI